MSDIDPKDDIRTLRDNLGRLNNVTEAFEEIGFQRDVFEAVHPYWESVDESGMKDFAVASAAGTVHLWAEQLKRATSAGETFMQECVFASSAAVNTASSTGTLAEMNSQVKFVSEKANGVLSKRLQRGRIRKALSHIDPLLADQFDTVWQYTCYPVSDPGRAPLSQMREFFTYFLHKLAPDEEVTAQPDFKPDLTLKKRKPESEGITRKHRVEYIAKVKADRGYAELMLSSWQSFDEVFKKLQTFHDQKRLDETMVKRCITQGEAVIQEWLRALGLLL